MKDRWSLYRWSKSAWALRNLHLNPEKVGFNPYLSLPVHVVHFLWYFLAVVPFEPWTYSFLRFPCFLSVLVQPYPWKPRQHQNPSVSGRILVFSETQATMWLWYNFILATYYLCHREQDKSSNIERPNYRFTSLKLKCWQLIFFSNACWKIVLMCTLVRIGLIFAKFATTLKLLINRRNVQPYREEK